MHRLFLLMALPCLAACQTDGSSSLLSPTPPPAEAKYSLFYDQADHLRDLLAAKRLTEAGEVVEMHWRWFESRLATQRERLGIVAADVNAKEQPKLEAAAAGLANPSDFQPADWPELRRRRGEAKAALAAYDKRALTRDPAFRSAQATALEATARRFDEAGQAAAPAAFAAYDHGGESGFFAGYPVELDRPAFLRAQLSALDGRGRQLAPDAVLRWHRALGRDVPLDAAQQARFGKWLVDASIRASGAKRPGWKEVQAAWRLASDNGLPAALPERPRMRAVLLDSEQGDRGASVQIATQGELAPERVTLAAALGDPNAELLLLIDPLERRMAQAVIERSSISSRFLAGERVVPNPAYEEARFRAMRAQDNLARAQYRAAMSSDDPETTGEALAGVVASFLEIVAGHRAENAIRDIRNIPPTLREPVYEDYKYEVAAVKANRIATVTWHVLDRAGGTWRQGSAKVEEAKTFRVPYRLHERDVRRQQILREHQTEEELAAWGDGAAMVPLGVVLRAAMSGEGYERKLGSLAQAGEELRKQRATMLAAVRPTPVPVSAAAVAKADARMDSVVVVVTPDGDGLGAGFYVTPDTVVTNAHVVRQHRFVDLKLHDGRKSFGRVMAVLDYADLAIVRTEARGTPVRLANGNGPEVGSTIEIIGHPKALEYSLSRGVVSAVRKRRISDVPGAGPITLVQTDAAASPGNSGGPWFLRDEVVAVTSFKRDGENLNFGIHVTELREFLRKHAVELP